jgi:AcrR family transcriptional regulator
MASDATVTGQKPGIEQKRRRIRSELTSAARRLTAERGLSGYTVQELSDAVGISRRTFFNYFPSKEDAVLGLGMGADEALIAEFMAAGASTSGSALIDDLAEFGIAHFTSVGLTRTEVEEFLAAIRREPSLLTTLLEFDQKQTQRFIEMVVSRDGGDDRDTAAVAVALMQTLMRLSGEEYFAETNARSFAEILRAKIAAATHLLSPAGDRDRPRLKDRVTTP